MAPITNRLPGANLPPIPNAVEGMICGRTIAPTDATAEFFRKVLLFDLVVIIV
jgi:hypothetical protein